MERRKERRKYDLEKKLRLLFDFQAFEKNSNLQAVIDAVHGRYSARPLSDDEVEYVAAAGRQEASYQHKKQKEECS